MADLYLTPAERYTAALGGFYYGDLPEPGTVYTQLIKDILDGSTPDKVPKNILARFVYSLYISDLGDPYPRYELAKLLYWKLHDITPTKSGSVLTVTIDGKEDYMTINTDLSRLWYKVLFGSKTDIITEFPYIFNTMQNKLSDWELFGNTVQTGTQTPQNPIQPQETGERTGNLFDKNNTTIYSAYFNASGSWLLSADSKSVKMPCQPNTQYTLSVPNSLEVFRVYESNNASIEPLSTSPPRATEITRETNISQYTFTTSSTAQIILFQGSNAAVTEWFNGLMLNTGSTALPYENFGYKIQILSGNTTTPVYLGEVESTRRVQKIIFTGSDSEGWTNQTLQRKIVSFPKPFGLPAGTTRIISSHFVTVQTNSPAIGELYVGGSWINFNYDNVNDLDTWKAYLAAQYAAGTPVTVWYVLATSTTGIVNEPLRKIGDYADSISMVQTGIDIPTVIGQNTLDVLTTVKPSSMSIEYVSADETKSRSKRISLLKSTLKK